MPHHSPTVLFRRLVLIVVVAAGMISCAENKQPSESDAAKQPDDKPVADAKQPAAEVETAPPYGNHTDDKEKIDYVKRNGAVFEKWPKPKVAVVVSGALGGFIEPCGCTGLENQKGGLSRRHTLIETLKKQGWPIVALDMGGVVQRFGPQATIKYRYALGALSTIGYDVVGLGIGELKLPGEDLLLAQQQEGKAQPFVSANVASAELDELGFRVPYKIVEAAGKRFGVTTILGDQRGRALQNPDFQWTAAVEALPAVVEKLKAEKCDHHVLLVSAPLEEAQLVARKFPQFDIVVAASDSDPPSPDAALIKGTKSRFIELSHKGMYVGVLAFFDDAKTPMRYQRVPLDGRFADSDDMRAMMTAYQDELRQAGLAGLELRPSPHPSGRTFVGSATCGECHTTAYDIWKKTPHSHATKPTLTALKPARQHDPECLSCHVTGWEPQEYYPFKSGYLDLKKTPLMRANGCENCHGPGSKHVAAENGDIDADDEMLAKLRESMRLTKANAPDHCMRCHDLDNDPHFDFKLRWPDIEHIGKD
jgi:hypothetical protein